jgi:hypothetical protein
VSDLKCIWCLRSSEDTLFNKKAHTIPQSLGGKNICKEVCDDCNHYFGRANDGDPSIETVLKEVFNISRARLIGNENIGKNKSLPRFSSVFFNVNFKKNRIDLKPKFKLQRGFQQRMCRQFKRGLFKIFLEESQRQQNKGFVRSFDFIRQFARYNIGDFPVFYFKRAYPIFPALPEWFKTPELLMEDRYPMLYLIRELNFFEFELLSHTFSIPTSSVWNLSFDLYKKKSLPLKEKFFNEFYAIDELRNIDLTLSILDKRD